MTSWDDVDTLCHVLELSGVRPDSAVVVRVDVDTPQHELDLLRLAIGRAGTAAIEVTPIGTTRDGRAGSREAAMFANLADQADLVIDCGTGPPVDDADGRVLRLGPTPSRAVAWPGHANLVGRTGRLRTAVSGATALRLTDRWGTDLELGLGLAEIAATAGVSTAPEPRADFPGGKLTVNVHASPVDGTIVVMPGDSNLTRGGHVESPVRLRVAGGRLTAIDGDTGAADIMRAVLERVGDPDAYRITRLTVGLNPGRGGLGHPFDPTLTDPDLGPIIAGVVGIEVGPLTVALAERTVEVDDLTVVMRGELVGDHAPDVYELPG